MGHATDQPAAPTPKHHPHPTPTTEARDLRTLLEAVRDALTLDHAAPDYNERLKERASLAKVVLRDGLDDPGWNADWLRNQLTAEQATAAEQATHHVARAAAPQVSQQPNTQPWEPGVNARYLALAGATIDIRESTGGHATAACQGCLYAWTGDILTAHTHAQTHAEKCRALPRPAVTG